MFEKLLRSGKRDFVEFQLAVEGGGQHVGLIDGAGFAAEGDGFSASSGNVRRQVHGELLVGGEIFEREIDVVVDLARLFLLQVGDRDLAVADFEFVERKPPAARSWLPVCSWRLLALGLVLMPEAPVLPVLVPGWRSSIRRLRL